MEDSIQNTDYFSMDNIGRLSRADEHLSFVEGIMEKYQHVGNTDRDWYHICQQIQLIRRKKNDRKLNLSVIGEFSTGKSTFINALLRRELLVSSALQGTTVASTVIDYSEKYEIELEYLDGRAGKKISYNSFWEQRKGLESFTTVSSVARLLKSVKVFLPADILKNEFRIIDTPGTNVTEAWHEDVTVRTLKEESDLSIILMSAEKPVPDTMIEFIRKNLESILPQCVFVVTKLDLIRLRERERQLAYIKMKLEEKLEIQDAVVLPYVSPMVLGSEGFIDDNPEETKVKLCVISSYTEGRKSMVEALLEGRIPDVFKGFFHAAPVLGFAYAKEPVVRIKLKEPVKPDSHFFRYCPDGLARIIKKYNGVNIPEIDVSYKAFCELLKKLEAYRQYQIERYGGYHFLFSAMSAGFPLEILKNKYDITICGISGLDTDSTALEKMQLAAGGAAAVVVPSREKELLSAREKTFMEEYILHFYGEKVIFAADLKEELAKLREHDDSEKVVVEDTLLKISLETEQKLIQHTTRQRTLAVTKKLTQLLNVIYQSLSNQMEQISKVYEGKLELLNRSQKVNLNVFVRQEKGERLQHFDRIMRTLSEDIEQRLSVRAAGACTIVIKNLDDKNTLDQLKAYINDSLGDDCRKQAEILLSEASNSFKRIQYLFGDEMKSFHISFQKIYESLNIIPLDMSQSKYDFPQKVEIKTADIASTANYIADELRNENTAFWGGAAAGAAIGTAMAPGIGTLIGGIIGAVVGSPNGEHTAKVRDECKGKLRPQLTNYYNSVSEKVTSAVDKYISQMRTCLSEEIDKYLKRYRSEVERQIAFENNRRSAINIQLNRLKTDMTGIQNHKKQLDSVIVQLNSLGRKES